MAAADQRQTLAPSGRVAGAGPAMLRVLLVPLAGARPAMLRVLLVALAGAALCAPPARAEGPVTRQARAAAADWLPYAPVPAARAAVCLVDTGADLNSDTEGALVERTAIDGGPGGDGAPGRHGTLMSMVMAAPRNGWGMVGAWPALRLVSVRALDGGYYANGIDRCRDRSRALDIRVILVAAGIPRAAPDSDPQLANAVDAARGRGINVVAAAGNQPGPVDHPANYPPVLAVGAADASGAACHFSASGAGLDLLAPGCELELAHPVSGEAGTSAGTSQAAAFAAATLAALRSHRPDLSVDEAEALLRAQGAATPHGPLLDAERVFRAAGLGSAVDAGRAALASLVAPAGDAEGAAAPAAAAGGAGAAPVPATAAGDQQSPKPRDGGPTLGRRLPTPRARARAVGRRLELLVANRPAPATLAVRAERARGGEFDRIVTIRRRASRVRLPLARWQRVTVHLEQPGHRRSRALILDPTSSTRPRSRRSPR
jgi:hypothetical protein